MRFTDVERDHLLTLLADAEAEGGYYGNKTQYWKRHERIKAKLLASAPAAPREMKAVVLSLASHIKAMAVFVPTDDGRRTSVAMADAAIALVMADAE